MVGDRIEERDLILPALSIIEKKPGFTTSALIAELTNLMQPTGRDSELLPGRNDTYFSQKVRNLLRSHNTLERLGYATAASTGRNSVHCITDAGRAFLRANADALTYVTADDFNYNDKRTALSDIGERAAKNKKVLVYDENIVITEGNHIQRMSQAYERSRRLRDMAVERHMRDGHIACAVCGFDFYEMYGDAGRGFIEIHHLKPVYQYEEADTSQFLEQALSNVAPVCSNCHRIIHRRRGVPLSIAELKAQIRPS